MKWEEHVSRVGGNILVMKEGEHFEDLGVDGLYCS
jgi:hypothetical protein